jgi:hypothetical protein
MSVEYIDYDFPCPCGRGTYTETHWSDDWLRSGISAHRMNCPSCRQTHGLYTVTGLSEPRFAPGVWLTHEEAQRRRDLANQEGRQWRAKLKRQHEEEVRRWMSMKHRPSYKDFNIRLEYYPAGSPEWLEAKAGLEAYTQKMDRAYEKRYGRRPAGPHLRGTE